MADMVFVLGAADPEMAVIEELLTDMMGVRYTYAVGSDGLRVHPGNAYRAICPPDATHVVECCDIIPDGVTRIDHHRPGDPGYGRPPEEYWDGSSIGQVIQILGQIGYDIGSTPEQRLTAAADHCLEAAYRGKCPGIDPSALMRWRAETRAAFQRRPVADVLADIEAARCLLKSAPRVSVWTEEYDHLTGEMILGSGLASWPIADLRGESIPELPEAAAREGIPFLADQIDRDGRRKIVLMAVPQGSSLVQRFLAGDIVPELADMYGDPARGFAGGYVE